MNIEETGETSVSEQSPLAATLERIAARNKYLAAHLLPAAGAGWLRASDLVTLGDGRLDQLLATIMAKYNTSDRRVAVAFFINSYAWWLPAAAIAGYATERRVPDLASDNVALRQKEQADQEEADLEVAFLSGRFAALPHDPAAGHPDALILSDEVALRKWLRERLEAHLTPMIAALYRRTRLGQRAQWNLVADDCDSLFLWVGQQIGGQERCCAEGLAFVQADGSPMRKSKIGYFTLEYNDHRETFRKRGGGCMFYEIGDGYNCSTCPLISEAERNGRLLAWMAQQKRQEQTA